MEFSILGILAEKDLLPFYLRIFQGLDQSKTNFSINYPENTELFENLTKFM